MVAGWKRVLRVCNSHGEDVVPANLQQDARQGTWRRSREDGAVHDRKKAAVAAAFEAVLVGAVKYRAGIVRADAAVGRIAGVARADQDAGSHVGGVLEDFRSADGDFARLRNYLRGSRGRVVPQAKSV